MPALTGIRASVSVCAVTFLLGSMCAHWTADAQTLWKAPSGPAVSPADQLASAHLAYASAGAYYVVLAKMPGWLSGAFAAVVTLGGTTLLWSLGDGRAGNIMFDGASVFLYGTALSVYLRSALPELTAHFAPMPVPSFAAVSSGQFPEALKQPTLALASAHLVVSLALTGVLLLQAGRWWSEQKDVRPDDEEMEEWVEVDAAEVKRRRDARDGKVDGIVQEYGTETNGDRDGQGQGQGQEMPKVVKQDDVKLATPPVKAVKVKNSS